MKHASIAELLDHAEGRSEASLRASLEEHLARCAECAAELDTVRRLTGLMRADRTPEPPESLVRAAVHLFQPEALSARVRAWLGDLTATVARLVFDSSAQPAFAAARGTPAARRLRFAAEGLELDLEIDRRGGRSHLTGQLTRHSGTAVEALAGARYLVFAGDSPLVEGTTDALGEFTATIDDRPGLSLMAATEQRAVRFPLPTGLAAEDATAESGGE